MRMLLVVLLLLLFSTNIFALQPAVVFRTGKQVFDVKNVTVTNITPVAPSGYCEGTAGFIVIKMVRKLRDRFSSLFRFGRTENNKMKTISGSVEFGHSKETFFTLEFSNAFVSKWELEQVIDKHKDLYFHEHIWINAPEVCFKSTEGKENIELTEWKKMNNVQSE